MRRSPSGREAGEAAGDDSRAFGRIHRAGRLGHGLPAPARRGGAGGVVFRTEQAESSQRLAIRRRRVHEGPHLEAISPPKGLEESSEPRGDPRSVGSGPRGRRPDTNEFDPRILIVDIHLPDGAV